MKPDLDTPLGTKLKCIEPYSDIIKVGDIVTLKGTYFVDNHEKYVRFANPGTGNLVGWKAERFEIYNEEEEVLSSLDLQQLITNMKGE